MSLAEIVRDLADLAKANEDRAYRILGARPGPGIDILIYPNEPIDGKWYVDGQTQAGKLFVHKFWRWQPLNNQKVAEMRKQANDWRLTHRTKYNVVSI